MNQTIPKDDAQIVNVQLDNHVRGKCFTPWVSSAFIVSGYVAPKYFDKEAN